MRVAPAPRGTLRRRLLFAAALAGAPGGFAAANDISAAEQALFIDPQLRHLHPPQTLRYAYRKSGSLEAGFDDSVELQLGRSADKGCCTARGRFLSGARTQPQPELEHASANPVILYFLERDIREMERLTGGKAPYFRNRIRLALSRDATLDEVALDYRGRRITVRRIEIRPYLDDPHRDRFEALAGKRYEFLLAADVPGGLYGIRTRVDGKSADAAPLVVEEMLAEGAPLTAAPPLAEGSAPR